VNWIVRRRAGFALGKVMDVCAPVVIGYHSSQGICLVTFPQFGQTPVAKGDVRASLLATVLFARVSFLA
jgi:hypothetical protein